MILHYIEISCKWQICKESEGVFMGGYSELSKRMKDDYENVVKPRLNDKEPIIIRIDGKAFRTFTRNLKKPFDDLFVRSMQQTVKYLCENIPNIIFGYQQSDEISLLLIKDEISTPWFNYDMQKLSSVSASMATMVFNNSFRQNANTWISEYHAWCNIAYDCDEEKDAYERALNNAMRLGAMFDSRCFNIAREDVIDYFFWRQSDASRASIRMAAQVHFSHQQLLKKTRDDIRYMLRDRKGIDWESFPIAYKWGVCCIKDEQGWKLDAQIPLFTNKNREYIEKLIGEKR